MDTLFGIVAALAAVLCAYAALDLYSTSLAAQFWKSTQGRLMETRVRSHSVDSEDELHYVDVEYEYTHLGTRYVGRQIRYNRPIAFPEKERALAFADTFSTQENVLVHFDPKDPGKAVLERERPVWPIAGLLFGSVGFAVASGKLLTAA